MNSFEETGVGQALPDNEVRFDPSPDEDLLAWEGIHEGDTVCIVANGESVNEVNLGRINCKTMALNKAWMLPKHFTYYCMGDTEQLRMASKHYGDIRKLKPLFTSQMGPLHATRFRGLPNKDYREFNFNLLDGIHLNNTITSYGLHLAVWMGFTKIRLIGVDCYGKHFYGGEPVPDWKFANQREALGFIAGILRAARPDIEILNLNMNTRCFAFPRARFESVFP